MSIMKKDHNAFQNALTEGFDSEKHANAANNQMFIRGSTNELYW